MQELFQDFWFKCGLAFSAFTSGVAYWLWRRIKHKILAHSDISRFGMTARKMLDMREILAEIRAVFEADRVTLKLFHNGTFYVNGNPIMKFSRVCESLGPGVGHIHGGETDITTESVPELILPLAETGFCMIRTEDLPPDSYLRARLASRGVVWSYNKAVVIKRGPSRNLIAFVTVEFIRHTQPWENGREKLESFIPRIIAAM